MISFKYQLIKGDDYIMDEKVLNNKKNGMVMLFLFIFLYLISIVCIISGGFLIEYSGNPVLLIIGIL